MSLVVQVALNQASAGSNLQAVASRALQAGQVIYTNPSGQFGLATCTSLPTCRVAGLVTADTAARFVATATTELLTLSDWTSITGNPSLFPGLPYFVGMMPGNMISIAPNTPGQVVAQVGMALTTMQFLFAPAPPILL